MIFQVYIGDNEWISDNLYELWMGLPKISQFIEEVARYIFGENTLLQSTVTGKKSNRSKEEPAVPVNRLDPTLVARMRGNYATYLFVYYYLFVSFLFQCRFPIPFLPMETIEF